VQRLGEHRLDQRVADRARRARARLIEQTPQTARDEAGPPLADCLSRHAERAGNLAIGALAATTEHDARPQRQRLRAVAMPRPRTELLLLFGAQ